MRRCTCKHVRQCPFGHAHPLDLVDDADQPVFRPLRDDEDPLDVQRGDACVGGQGEVRVLARAVDPDAEVARLRRLVGTRCRAKSWLWRRLHP